MNDLDGDLEDHFYLADLESWNVLDIVRYNKAELLHMVKDFFKDHTLQKLEERIGAIKTSNKFIEAHKYPLQQEYTSEYLAALHEYLSMKGHRKKKKRLACKRRKEVVFLKVTREQINYFRDLMKNPKTRNLTLELKQQLINNMFKTKLSRSTIYKMQR